MGSVLKEKEKSDLIYYFPDTDRDKGTSVQTRSRLGPSVGPCTFLLFRCRFLLLRYGTSGLPPVPVPRRPPGPDSPAPSPRQTGVCLSPLVQPPPRGCHPTTSHQSGPTSVLCPYPQGSPISRDSEELPGCLSSLQRFKPLPILPPHHPTKPTSSSSQSRTWVRGRTMGVEKWKVGTRVQPGVEVRRKEGGTEGTGVRTGSEGDSR